MSASNEPPSDYGMNTLEEFRKVRLQFRVAGAVAVGILSAGAVFYHYVEHFSWLNSFYFATVTLATVGYGDLVPHTVAGKIFTIFYILTGIGIIAFFVNTMVKNSVLRREVRRSKREMIAAGGNRKLDKEKAYGGNTHSYGRQ